MNGSDWIWLNYLHIHVVVIHNSLCLVNMFLRKFCSLYFFLWNEGQWPRNPTRISYKYNKLAGIIPIQVQHIKTCHSPDIIDLVQRVIKSYCELNGFLQSSSLCLHVFADVPFVLLLTITNFCIDIFYPKVITD